MLSTPVKRWTVIAAVLGSAVVFLDGTVINVALPRIGRELPVHFVGVLEGQSYIYSGYLLALSALLILAGAISDFYGRRRIFALGLIGFWHGLRAWRSGPPSWPWGHYGWFGFPRRAFRGSSRRATRPPSGRPPGYFIDFLPDSLVFGVGLCIMVAPLTTAVMTSVPVHNSSLASAINAISRIGPQPGHRIARRAPAAKPAEYATAIDLAAGRAGGPPGLHRRLPPRHPGDRRLACLRRPDQRHRHRKSSRATNDR